MKRFIKAAYDATVYEGYPNRNTGLDEILEIGKDVELRKISRALIYFDLPTDIASQPETEYFLLLHIADAKYVHRYSTLEVLPISGSWREGSGYFYQDVKNVEDGVSWNTRDGTTTWSELGGDTLNTPTASFAFNDILRIANFRINVTDIIRNSDPDTWHGIMVKFSDEVETDSTNFSNIKLFSSNTHTIFSPRLESFRIEQTFVTGSLKPIANSTVSIIPRNMKEAYTLGEQDKIYLVVRDKYPDKRFDATQRYRNQYYLPSSSYYRIRDQVTDLEIFSFDAASAIQCDASGSFITLDTSGLDVNRYYDIELKVQTEQLVFFPTFKYTFRIDNAD
jgi:hypothetical protein